MSSRNNGTGVLHFFEKLWDRKWKRIIISILCVLLVLVLVAGTAYTVMWHSGKHAMLSSKAPNSAPDGYDFDIDDDGNTVKYKNKIYRYNTDMASVLFIGTDHITRNFKTGLYGENGQADALYLIAIDTLSGKVSVIAVPRDMMTEIQIFSSSGNFIGNEKKQVCLAYAYGDGKEKSCENTVSAVSGLMYGIDINTYFCMDKVVFADMANVIGGVTVPEYDDSFKPTGRNVTLNGNKLLDYLFKRDINALESNSNRVERQVNFLKAFSAKTIEQTKKDITVPLNLYNKLSKKSISTVDASKITYLTSVFMNGGTDLEFMTLPGTTKQGEKYAEMYPDEKAVYELILKVFYKEVKAVSSK